MSDTRPSEDTDPIQLPGMRAAGFFNDLPTVGRDFYTAPEPDEQDPIADLIEQAHEAGDPTRGLMLAQLATVLAIREQTDALRKAVER